MSLQKLTFEVWPEFTFVSERLAIRDFSRLSCAQLANQTAVRFGDAKPLAPRTGAIVPPVEKTATVGPPLWSHLPRAGPRLTSP